MSRHNYTPEQQIIAFWSKVAITADDDKCWLWLASKNRWGYGNIKWQGKMERANRVAWMMPNYVIPDGMIICHSCDNTSCVNPKHLFLGTHQDNMTDKVKKGRHVSLYGEDHPSHKISDEDVKYIRERYAMGGITYREIGEQLGISGDHVGAIVRRIWRKQ